ncbi:MAG: extracellular solute-binding protein [Rhizobiaceae bacterium]|nr:extracellular solute-binding protein [Rhizobiaceae bacterium]
MRFRYRSAAMSAALILGLTPLAHSEENTLVWVDGGGAYHDTVQKEILDTWKAPEGMSIVSVAGTDNAKLRAMVESNRVVWDVYNGDNTWGTEADGEWLEPLDYSVINKDDIVPEFASKYRVANMIYSIQLAYNTDKVTTKPAGWADFFDLEKFPGKRAVMDYSAGGIFEIALLADGVAPADLYPLDIDRAIRKLDTIKSSLVYWQSGAQSEELVGSGEVSMVMTYNARAYDAKVALEMPVDYIFEGQILAAAYLTVPKGSKHVKAAMDLIAYAVSADVNGKLSTDLPLAPSNTKTQVNPEMSPDLPTSHLDKPYAVFDDQWIAANSAMLEQRYQAWKSAAQ